MSTPNAQLVWYLAGGLASLAVTLLMTSFGGIWHVLGGFWPWLEESDFDSKDLRYWAMWLLAIAAAAAGFALYLDSTANVEPPAGGGTVTTMHPGQPVLVDDGNIVVDEP